MAARGSSSRKKSSASSRRATCREPKVAWPRLGSCAEPRIKCATTRRIPGSAPIACSPAQVDLGGPPIWMSRRPRLAHDRFGLAWRAEIAAELLDNLHHLDVIELVAEHLFKVGDDTLRAFAALRPHVDLVLHGVSMGLATIRRPPPTVARKTA